MKSERTSKELTMLLIDVVVLAAAFLTFGSGLVLFFGFHVGEGAFRTSSLGLNRLTWLNLHRLPALMVALGIGLHVALNWRAFVGRCRRSLSRKGGSRDVLELVMYVAFWTVALAGMAVWLLIGGSAPLAGPVQLGRLPQVRHHVVDVHNIAGLVAFLLTVHHVCHRWRRMVRGLRTAWHTVGEERCLTWPKVSKFTTR